MTVRDIQVDCGSISTGPAALAQQAQHVNGCSDDAEQPLVFSDEEFLPTRRTADQEDAHRTLQRVFLSWERALQKTAAGDRLEVLQNALRELFPVAELAGAVHDVAAWAVDYGNIYGLDPDSVQRIMVEAKEAKPWNSQTKTSVVNVVSVVPPWPKLDDAALHGVAGELVKAIEPHSEADPVALLIQTLVLAGNIIGHNPFYAVESDHHRSNLFAVLVGNTSKARKGTSAGRVMAIAKLADQTWSDDRVKGGLSSGEGLINEVRDAVQKWDAKAKTFETVDPGVVDKRLLVLEPEFSGALAVAERHGNVLTEIIRRARDGHKLSTLTKNSPLSATDPHISIIGHITVEELRARITRTDMANGFANRFLFAMVRRSKKLPFGGDLGADEITKLGNRLQSAIGNTRIVGRVKMTSTARKEWAAVYESLSDGQAGLLGAITARAEAQVVRLALIYALLDGQTEIDEPHLKAALAVWEYCEASVAYIFGDALGDPVADEILRALSQAGPKGVSRTAIRDLFGRNQSGERIGAALQLLATKGRAYPGTVETGGRPAETWFAR
jgi:hypothetical protein